LRDKKKLEKLRGVHIAFNTPFDGEGEVSPDAVRKLIDCYKNTGVDGVYVCGFIIYNIPNTTGYDLSMELFTEMASMEKVYGIKNTTFNAYQILQFRKAAGDDFVIYNGPDEQYLAGRLMGADGGIGGSYGVMPELYAAMERAIRKTDIKTAQQIQGAVDHIISQMYSLSSFCGAAKEIIKIRFTDIGAPRLPQAPLTNQDRQKARGIADEIGKLVCSFDEKGR